MINLLMQNHISSNSTSKVFHQVTNMIEIENLLQSESLSQLSTKKNNDNSYSAINGIEITVNTILIKAIDNPQKHVPEIIIKLPKAYQKDNKIFLLNLIYHEDVAHLNLDYYQYLNNCYILNNYNNNANNCSCNNNYFLQPIRYEMAQNDNTTQIILSSCIIDIRCDYLLYIDGAYCILELKLSNNDNDDDTQYKLCLKNYWNIQKKQLYNNRTIFDGATAKKKNLINKKMPKILKLIASH